MDHSSNPSLCEPPLDSLKASQTSTTLSLAIEAIPKISKIMVLPMEIRQKIIQLVCVVRHKLLIRHRKRVGPSSHQRSGLALLYVCRQLYCEGSRVYYANNTFRYDEFAGRNDMIDNILPDGLVGFVTDIGSGNAAYISKLSINWMMPHSAEALWLFPNLQHLQLFGICTTLEIWKILGHPMCRLPHEVVDALEHHFPSICAPGLMDLIRSKPISVDLIFWPIMRCSCQFCVVSLSKFWEEVSRDGEAFSELRWRWNRAYGAVMDSLWMINGTLSGQ